MQKRQLNNLIKRVFNKPQFITLEDLQPIADYLQDPVRAATLKIEKVEPVIIERAAYNDQESYDNARKEALGIDPKSGIGYISLEGALVNRAGTIRSCVELTSYEGLKSTFEAQVREGITTCVMMIDSGGGEAYRAFASANAVRKLATENGVKIIAYVDGTSASAAYAWAVIADEIIANPMARVGSVGVVVQLYNDTGYLEKMGVKRSFIYAGGNKVPFDASGEFTQSFLDGLQESVDTSYNSFVNHVASNRKMDVQAVIDTQASLYDAEKALSVGFVDKIMEVEDFDAYLSNFALNKPQGSNQVSLESAQDKIEETMSDTIQVEATTELNVEVQTLQEAVAELTTTNTSLNATVAGLQTQLAEQVVKFEAANAELTKFKADTKAEARKTQLAQVFGSESEKVAQYSTMFANVDDAAFSVLVADLDATHKAVKEEMAEIGHSTKEQAVAKDPSSSLEDRAKQRKANQA